MRKKLKLSTHAINNNTWIVQKYFPYNENPRAIIFLDRDDTLIKDFGDDTHKKMPRFNLDLVTCLKRISQELDHSIILVIVTNQSRIDSNKTSMLALRRFHLAVVLYGRLLGIKINKIVTCPHSHLSKCKCRKPSPVMILDTIKSLNCSTIPKFMIGNSLSDIQAGLSAKCFTIRISHNETTPDPKQNNKLFLGYFTLKSNFAPIVLKIIEDKII
jgi:D-glycero-D-manno-heptose 1,7-bisphosphate phosphatase